MKKIMIFLSTICIMLIFAIHIDAHASQQFMTEDDARYFLNFVYNRNINNDDLKNDENYKMLTGTLEDGVDANAIKFNFLKVLQGQINNNIDKASYNCDILRSDLQGYLEKKAAGMKDLPEQEYNAFLNKQLKTLEDAFVDWLCSEAATRAGIYVTDNILDNIKLASSSYSKLVGAPQKAIAYADYVINGFRAALLVFDEECAGRYSYFSVYLSNRKAYSDDTIFETIMSYNKLAITQNYPLGTIDWYMGSKDSWIEHIDDIERWADITIQVENSIEGVNGTTSSGSTTTPTPENTTITFTKDTYITDTSDYMGYAWNLNGHTVVIDGDLTTSKNINTNNGALIVTGNMSYSGNLFNIENGYLIVEGNLIQSGYNSTINVGAGTLEIGGNYNANYGTFDAGSGKTEILGNFLSETETTYKMYFKMQNPNAYVLVNGDFIMKSKADNEDNITAGTLEIKGDFIQAEGRSWNFKATGTHKVILSGTEEQIVSFASGRTISGGGTTSRICILESKNENVIFEKGVFVNTICDNSTFTTLRLYGGGFENGANVKIKNYLYCESTVNLNSATVDVEGNMTVYGSVNINSGTLNVLGNLSQSGLYSTDAINVGTGILKIGGDYAATYGEFNAGCGITEIKGSFLSKGWNSNTWSATTFKMQNENAYMLVKGDFKIVSGAGNKYNYCNVGNITAGTLEVQGNFYAGGSSSYGYASYSFPATGTHKVILSGTNSQNIYFYNSCSYFNILVNKNPNIVLKTSYYKHLFNEIPYIVNFETNTSKGTITKILDSTNETSATTQISSLGTLSKSGYYFKGWYLDEEYTMPLTAENDIITSDITLYAKWAEPMSFNDVSYSSESNEIAVNISLDEELVSQNGIVIIAVYDDTRLITTYHTDTEEMVSYTFKNVPITENGYTIKAFCWSDLETLIPLCNSINQQIQ